MIHDGLDLDASTAGTWSSRRRSSRASSGSRARSRTRGRCARTSARSTAQRRGALRRTRSFRSATSTADESAAPRHVAREARGAEAGLRSRGNDHGRQRAGRQRRRRRASSSLARSSRSAAGSRSLATIVAQGYVADEFAYLARTPGEARASARSTKAGKTIDDVERVEINEAFSLGRAQLGRAARRRPGDA